MLRKLHIYLCLLLATLPPEEIIEEHKKYGLEENLAENLYTSRVTIPSPPIGNPYLPNTSESRILPPIYPPYPPYQPFPNPTQSFRPQPIPKPCFKPCPIPYPCYKPCPIPYPCCNPCPVPQHDPCNPCPPRHRHKRRRRNPCDPCEPQHRHPSPPPFPFPICPSTPPPPHHHNRPVFNYPDGSW